MSSDVEQILEKLDEQKTAYDREFRDIKLSQKSMHDDIKEQRKEAREDNKEIWQELNEMERTQRRIEVDAMKDRGRIHVLENSNKAVTQNQQGIIKNLKKNEIALQNHAGNSDTHFNEDKASETKLAYLGKKKLLYILLTLLSSIVAGITAWISQGMPGVSP